MVGLIDVKQRGGASVGYWVNYVTLTFDLTHDLDLVVSRSKFEIALSEEFCGGLIDMERKGCESIIHDHDRDLCIVTGVTSDAGVPSTYLVDIELMTDIDGLIIQLEMYLHC